MSDVVESILELIRRLPPEQQSELVRGISQLARNGERPSLAEIEPASVGRILRPLSADDDLLEELGS